MGTHISSGAGIKSATIDTSQPTAQAKETQSGIKGGKDLGGRAVAFLKDVGLIVLPKSIQDRLGAQAYLDRTVAKAASMFSQKQGLTDTQKDQAIKTLKERVVSMIDPALQDKTTISLKFCRAVQEATSMSLAYLAGELQTPLEDPLASGEDTEIHELNQKISGLIQEADIKATQIKMLEGELGIKFAEATSEEQKARDTGEDTTGDASKLSVRFLQKEAQHLKQEFEKDGWGQNLKDMNKRNEAAFKEDFTRDYKAKLSPKEQAQLQRDPKKQLDIAKKAHAAWMMSGKRAAPMSILLSEKLEKLADMARANIAKAAATRYSDPSNRTNIVDLSLEESKNPEHYDPRQLFVSEQVLEQKFSGAELESKLKSINDSVKMIGGFIEGRLPQVKTSNADPKGETLRTQITEQQGKVNELREELKTLRSEIGELQGTLANKFAAFKERNPSIDEPPPLPPRNTPKTQTKNTLATDGLQDGQAYKPTPQSAKETSPYERPRSFSGYEMASSSPFGYNDARTSIDGTLDRETTLDERALDERALDERAPLPLPPDQDQELYSQAIDNEDPYSQTVDDEDPYSTIDDDTEAVGNASSRRPASAPQETKTTQTAREAIYEEPHIHIDNYQNLTLGGRGQIDQTGGEQIDQTGRGQTTKETDDPYTDINETSSLESPSDWLQVDEDGDRELPSDWTNPTTTEQPEAEETLTQEEKQALYARVDPQAIRAKKEKKATLSQSQTLPPNATSPAIDSDPQTEILDIEDIKIEIEEDDVAPSLPERTQDRIIAPDGGSLLDAENVKNE